MPPPQLALCLKDTDWIEDTARVMSAASSGLDLQVGNDLMTTLERIPPTSLRLLVTDGHNLLDAVETLSANYPHAAILGLVDEIGDAMLAAALRCPQLIGFVAHDDANLRHWELGYVVRRAVAPQQPIPGAHELLTWGASTVTFRPKTTRDRDQTVQAVEMVAIRFGISRRAAAMAADASHELLMNAMYDAPVDESGHSRYASDRQAQISLLEHEVPTLRLTVDGEYLALDISDPFGRLQRSKVFGGLLRGRTGAMAPSSASVLDMSHGGAGLGMFNLFNSAAILRIEVSPGRQTMVSWMLDRRVTQRSQRTQSRSLYFLEARHSGRG